jgi:hypothetical protein
MLEDGVVPLPIQRAALFLSGADALLIRSNEVHRLQPGASAMLSSGSRLLWHPKECWPMPMLRECTPEYGRRPQLFPCEVRDGDDHPLPIRTSGITLIGRDQQCDIVLSDGSVSAFHCAITRTKSGLRVTDLCSRNGVHVDGVRVGSAELYGHHRIQIGRATLTHVAAGSNSSGSVDLPSASMQEIYRRIRLYAPSSAPLHICGESGVGKEVIAGRVHAASGRMGPMIALNAASLRKDLAASELFGHVAGAFTGAIRAQAGAFRAADKGTLFLDEVGELEASVQADLLRVLETGQVRPVGAPDSHTVNVRLLTATHRDLRQQVRDGHFREDLFHRIWVLDLPVPPLRERRADIEPLADHFLRTQTPPRTLSRMAGRALVRHDWPGNTRELNNVLRRACALTDAGMLGPEHLLLTPLGTAPAECLTQQIVQAYLQNGGKVGRTAKALGLHRTTVYRHIRLAQSGKGATV